MAVDNEARSKSSSALAMAIGVLLLAAAAIAYMATRPTETAQTTVISAPAAPPQNTTVIQREVPVAPAAPNVVVVPGNATSGRVQTSESSTTTQTKVDANGNTSTSVTTNSAR